ncbi:galanin peptides isoform X1 [Alligator mississippiensis]|nr:galanin peptides isoform X1 [Alligator mississippiensis]
MCLVGTEQGETPELSHMNPRATLCLSLALCWLLAESFGMALMPKDKRGWTLNSAGYLLGPHAHHTLIEKGALAGKREAVEDIDLLGSEHFGDPVHPMDESAIHTLLDSLPYLHLQELGALERLAFPNGAIQP